METVQKLPDDVKQFVKAILVNGGNVEAMAWFRAGAQYMDGVTCLVMGLPNDDPTLAEVVKSLVDGTFYDAETIARNTLRWNMARHELDVFVRMNAPKSASQTLLMHARALIQREVEPQVLPDEPSLWGFWVANMKIVFWVSPIVTWMIARRAWGSSFGARGSLRQRWAAALRDPAWWVMVALVAGGIIFALN